MDSGTAIISTQGCNMHFVFLIEDQSGKKMLENLIPSIIGEQHSFKLHSYKGIGHLPKNLKSQTDVNKRILLDQLPRLLRGFGNTFSNYPSNYPVVLFVVCDLDDNCLKMFRQDLINVLNSCYPKPETQFCFAIEEGEAWFLGDLAAIRKAYPDAKSSELNRYQNDSICDTWELLADAICPGGSKKLKEEGWQAVGKKKSEWAERITPNMDINNNKSPSFCYFRDKIRKLM